MSESVDSESPLSDRDGAVIDLAADQLLDGGEGPTLKLAARASVVAVDRWGRDLDRDAPEQRWGSFEQAVEQAAVDVIEHYRTPAGDVEGVDGVVFEGRPITPDALTAAAEEVTRAVEQAAPGGFDRHEPGGLVEPDGGEP